MSAWLPVLAHGVGVVFSLVVGQWVVGWLLRRLKLYNAHHDAPATGPERVGRAIGCAERFIVYAAVVTGQAAWLAVLFTLKTVVRYPEIRAAADERPARPEAVVPSSSEASGQAEPPPGGFAEYYLAGTLFSFALGIAVPLAVLTLLRLAVR